MADSNITTETITHALHSGDEQPQQPQQHEQQQQQQQHEQQQPSESHEQALARSYDDLARRDRELHAREVAYKEGQKAIKELAALRQRAKEDPYAVTRDLGIDTLALGDAIMGNTEEPEQNTADVYAQKIQELERWKQEQELRYARNEQKRIIRRALHADETADFGILRNLHADYSDQIEEEILNVAEDWYRRTGESQDYNKIIAHIEKQKEKEFYALTNRFNNITKLKEGKSQPATILPLNDMGAPGKPAATLSNDMAGQPPHEDKKPLTREDRRRLFLQSGFLKK